MATYSYYHPTKRPPPKGDSLHDAPHHIWPGHSHCDNCGWTGWIEDLIDGKYCPRNAAPGHPATARPEAKA